MKIIKEANIEHDSLRLIYTRGERQQLSLARLRILNSMSLAALWRRHDHGSAGFEHSYCVASGLELKKHRHTETHIGRH